MLRLLTSIFFGPNKNSEARKSDLAVTLAKRDILGRYKGSAIGLAWTFLLPLLMLGVYTFVFGSILNARWGGAETAGSDGASLDFALLLFIGLMLHSFMTEVLMRAPSIIVAHSNIVKKVVFPVEILPFMLVLTSLFHFFISFSVFLTFFFFVKGYIHLTVLWIPVIVLPLAIMLCGISWFIAAVAVYYRDFGHLIGFVSTILLFLSPIFYPASRFPEAFLPLFQLNPLTFIIEEARASAFSGVMPDLAGLGLYTVVAVVIAFTGRYLFGNMRKGFNDVL